MKNMPTYEELLAQNSALKKQVKYLGNQTEKAEKKYEQAQSEIKNLTLHNMANWMIKGANLLRPNICGFTKQGSLREIRLFCMTMRSEEAENLQRNF